MPVVLHFVRLAELSQEIFLGWQSICISFEVSSNVASPKSFCTRLMPSLQCGFALLAPRLA
jgi:hypothetical protein